MLGATGRAGDAGVFSNCTLKKSLENKTLNLPQPQTIGEFQQKFFIIL